MAVLKRCSERRKMKKRVSKIIWAINGWKACALLAGIAAVTGACATQLLNEKQGIALQAAVAAGQKDLGCRELSPTVTAREVGQPALQGTWVEGVYRAEYWIRVEGCGKQRTYWVICPDPDIRCFNVGPGGLADWE
jgi:hypothetical protein